MVSGITIRGVWYNLDTKWSEPMFCELWKTNSNILAMPLKDRDKEMQTDWVELQKFLPTKKVKAE